MTWFIVAVIISFCLGVSIGKAITREMEKKHNEVPELSRLGKILYSPGYCVLYLHDALVRIITNLIYVDAEANSGDNSE